MKWLETKVSIHSSDKALALEIVSNVFFEMDLKGVVIDDEDVVFKKIDENAGAMDSVPKVTGYWPADKHTALKCRRLEKKLSDLRQEWGIASKVAYRKIDDQHWSEYWKTFFGPEKVGQNIVVKPSWLAYTVQADEVVLEIDPGMAFGTGTHPTTGLCISMIERYLRRDAAVLDIGTGSGILMLAAAKLGAEKVVGIDNDPVAVEVARKNLLRNDIESSKFMVLRGDLAEAVQQKFDLVTANILTKTILALLDQIKAVLVKGGIFVASGILKEQSDEVVEKMTSTGFEEPDVQEQDNWIVIAGRLSLKKDRE